MARWKDGLDEPPKIHWILGADVDGKGQGSVSIRCRPVTKFTKFHGSSRGFVFGDGSQATTHLPDVNCSLCRAAAEKVSSPRPVPTRPSKACPFCGAVDDGINIAQAKDSLDGVHFDLIPQMECLRCGARGPVGDDPRELWDVRSEPDPKTRRRRRLKLVKVDMGDSAKLPQSPETIMENADRLRAKIEDGEGRTVIYLNGVSRPAREGEPLSYEAIVRWYVDRRGGRTGFGHTVSWSMPRGPSGTLSPGQLVLIRAGMRISCDITDGA